MRRLFPSSGPAPAAVPASAAPPAPFSSPVTADGADGGAWSIDALADAYAYPDDLHGAGAAGGTNRTSATGGGGGTGGVWLRANMVTSLDGAAYHDGRAKPLSSDADMRIFGVLRGLADAVLVGAETVRQEEYRPARGREVFAARREAAGQAPAPAIAVVSAGLDLDFSLPLFTEPLVPTLLVTGAAAPSDRVAAARAAGVEIVFVGEGAAVDLTRVPAALAERGLRRLLTEGGPRLLGQLMAADLLDELCLTVSPRATSGTAPRIVNGPVLEVPADFRLDGVLEEEGFLFTRYRRIRQSAE